MKKKIGVLTLFLLSVLLGCMTMYYPESITRIAEEQYPYSIERVRADIKTIAEAPHTTVHHREALKEVREYITAEMSEMGLTPEIHTYSTIKTKKGDIVELNNIVATLDGQERENSSYILLMAHYDSGMPIAINDKGYCYGAADDGYGVATILETLRNIRNTDKPLKNGIKVLITDGEEIGLLGSEQEFKNHELYKNVAYVVNLEARGTGGPVIMVQTNVKNSRVLELYKSSDYPMTTSLVSDLYRGSGRSDFYHSERIGLPGINYAIMDKVENYHTPDDSYQNISEYSLKHYGNQVMSLVQQFVYSDKYRDVDYFKEGSESIFFTLLPNVVVSYPVTVGKVLSLVLVFAVTVLFYMKKQKLKATLFETVKNLVLTVVVAGVGYLVSYAMARLFGVTYDMNYMCKVPGDDSLVMLLPIILAIVLGVMAYKSKMDSEASLLSGVLIYTALLAVTIFILPGSSYLFMFPLILVLLAFGLMKVIPNEKAGYFLMAAVVMTALVFMPLFNVFNMAFSIASMPIVFVLVMVMNMIIGPVLKAIMALETK